MNNKDFKASLPYLFKAQITPFVWGHSGEGKTTTVKAYAKEMGYKYFGLYLGTQSDIGDVLGLASFIKDKNGSEIATTFATPIWLKEMIDHCENHPKSGGIIFLDEFNLARKDMLNGMFSLALDKLFHNIKLPTNCYLIAAGNPDTDDYAVTTISSTALMSRFAHIKLEATFNEWVEYAKASEMEPSLVSFLQEQPELLTDVKQAFTLPIKVDKRCWSLVDRLFKVGTPMHLLEQLMGGVIGVERLVAYKLSLQNQDRPLTAEQVFSGSKTEVLKKWSNPLDIKSSLLSITCDNVFDTVVKSNTAGESFPKDFANNFMDFLEILPREVAYTLLKRLLKAELKNFKAFISDKAYEARLTAIAKAAKGIA